MSQPCMQEARIATIESNTNVAVNEIKHLVQRLDSLTSVLYGISILMGGCMATAMGYLITEWVKGG